MNEKKSHWNPARRIQWLGFIVDSDDMKFYVSEEKLTVFISVIDWLLMPGCRLTARELAKFVGRAVSMERALGCNARLMSRSAARLCAAARHWDDHVQLDVLATREMRFLRERARYLNGHAISRTAPESALQCFSDASNSGYGAYIIAPLILSAQGQWSPDESRRSSTWRELAAVQRALVALQSQLAGQVLQWHCDNAAAVHILDYGSSKPPLQLLAVHIVEICLRNRIRLFPVWIPRDENSVADELSRCTLEVDCDDWQLQPLVSIFGFPLGTAYGGSFCR